MRIILIAAAMLLLALGVFYLANQPGEGPVAVAPDAAQSFEEPSLSETTAAVAAPTFTIVRVDTKGKAVVAGRGAPGARIELLSDGVVIADGDADQRGEWVILVDTPLSPGGQELSLRMTTVDGTEIKSDQALLIAAPTRPDQRPLVILAEPGGASRVLQSAVEDTSDLGPLALEAVDYDEAGGLIFSGRARPGALVRIYANNQLIGETVADEDGRWSLSPAATVVLPAGVYTLQIDQLDENGVVDAIVELPFERAPIEDVLLADKSVIVQPGNSLWRIARRLYGEGLQYTVIYEANRSQIRDPDLIYPGQILDTPGADIVDPSEPAE
ncbi:MAG: LysM peptidoglycan-binding domain-containing protein [Pseudomonadota bacterium]